MTRWTEARVELENQLKKFHETKEYKDWKENPTKENLEKARAKRKEIVK